MTQRSAATRSAILPVFLTGGLMVLAGCAPTQNATRSPETAPSQQIVTPWGSSSPAQSATTPAAPTGTTVAAPTPMAAHPGAAQQRQIDEARIALGILDRMANRCLTEADASACNTLQVNWPTLSRQLRTTLDTLSGGNMSHSPVIPGEVPVNPASVPRRAPAAEASPSMEMEIPMTPSTMP
ncbi:MAG: hypothetical protein ABID63_07735 [Pseudomonadota bacterium]